MLGHKFAVADNLRVCHYLLGCGVLHLSAQPEWWYITLAGVFFSGARAKPQQCCVHPDDAGSLFTADAQGVEIRGWWESIRQLHEKVYIFLWL